ncbi:hypothetical protein, partial [Caballeronia sp.]|uniref:hypothetical protein n=1 Tax=Caballeronia sp. TaxID=1931223 RepID=UPI003C4B6F9A
MQSNNQTVRALVQAGSALDEQDNPFKNDAARRTDGARILQLAACVGAAERPVENGSTGQA